MKKSLFAILLIFTAFILVGCKENKTDIKAPTILSAYQDTNGTVYLKCELTNKTDSPYVYFGDVDEEHSTQLTDGDVQILNYSSDKNGFYYHGSDYQGEPAFEPGDTIKVKIREHETETTNKSDLSKAYTFVIKGSQTDTNNDLVDYNSIIKTEDFSDYWSINDPNEDMDKYGIAYDQNQNEFVLARSVVSNVVETSENTYSFTKSIEKYDTFFVPYEFCLLTAEQVANNTVNGTVNLNDNAINSLTFKPYDEFEITDEYFVDEVTTTSTQILPNPTTPQILTNKVCYMVYRLKETSTKLPSHFKICVIKKAYSEFKFVNNIDSNNDPETQNTVGLANLTTDINGNYTLTFNPKQPEPTTEITHEQLKVIIKFVRQIYFGNTNGQSEIVPINGASIEINGGESVTSENFDNKVTLVGKIGTETKLTVQVTVKAPPAMPQP